MTDYPFLRREWLLALAESGAVAAPGSNDDRTGWHDISCRAGEGVLPLYRKAHSWGEYVFDHGWADAYARHGLHYYPKLVTAIPYTPVTGPRWRLPQGVSDAAGWLWPRIQEALAAHQASGWHLLFPDQAAAEALAELPLITRQACHFRWFNRDYQTFDDFLAALVSRKRKSLRRERQRVLEQGLTIQRAAGAAIPAHWWDVFYACYADTYLRRGQSPYLAPAFFRAIREQMGEQLMLTAAFADNPEQPVAMAIYLFDGQGLYGRYWGALQDYDALHFELCYYQGIEFAIEQQLALFDPGVQGEHKLLRGFEPVITRSLHHLVEPAFHQAVADFCEREAHAVLAYRDEARTLLPYRAG
ncbi:GNAT family N-acetyltransferase [Alcanivorax quisquiliarum]|uniref:GNAT family N-acetyltransferase n=1 Tax=Alcanivorax quisquiliarum TaxID=2933565 RepID=A0ABT0E606_9GAMM|nr:GNAT family N-acetyltransferase [Alcanivorax quisquiliarum]MCK0537262.1 GNAT family N-acetyltransferase [Alcanivorax quisquiliarum]